MEFFLGFSWDVWTGKAGSGFALGMVVGSCGAEGVSSIIRFNLAGFE